MSKKDYELIAKTLRSIRPIVGWTADLPGRQDQWARTVSTMADALAAENPKFQNGTFITACFGQR